MTNILPPSADKRLRSEYRARFLLVGSIVLIVCAAFFLFAMAPAEIALFTAIPVPVTSTQDSNTNAPSDAGVIKHAKLLVGVLAPFTATTSLDELSAVLSARAAGISIESISYNVTGKTITINGTANSPNAVNAYHLALQSDPRFTNVSVPIGALLGEQNGGFTMTVSGTF
jgi:hypothetical protein